MSVRLLEVVVVGGPHALDSSSSVKLRPDDLISLDELVEFPVKSIILFIKHGSVFLKSFLFGQLVQVGASESLLLASGSFEVSSDAVSLLFSFSESGFEVSCLRTEIADL